MTSLKGRYKLAPIVSAKIEQLMSGWKSIHHEMEIIYIVEGSAKIKISNMTFTAKKGELYFVNPMEIHSVTAVDNKPHLHYCICFDLSLIADKSLTKAILNGKVSILNNIADKNQDFSRIVELFMALYDAVEKQNKTLMLDASAYASMMFSELINGGYAIENDKHDKSKNFIKRSMEYISEHYTERLTSKQIAEALFYDQSYYCRVFKNNFGVSFSEYLNIYRILMAQDMLNDHSKKIVEVASECGFTSQTYFTKCFRKNIGMTPMEYRNQ